MASILLLAATDRLENRKDDALSKQLADAESVAERVSKSVTTSIALLLPNPDDYGSISSDLHPTLASLNRIDADGELGSFKAVVAIPPQEDCEGPLAPAVAQTLNHFMEFGKICALCSETTLALRWMLSPDTVGLYKSKHIPSDENLCEHLASQIK